MASNVNPAIPPFGNATTSGVRANFAAAKAEIEDLQKKDAIEIELANDSVQAFYLCTANNTPQVIPFSAVASKYPTDSTLYTVNLATGEVTFTQPGYYNVTVSAQGIRQGTGTGLVDWMVHTEMKVPAGQFVQSNSRKTTFNKDSANTTAFYSLARVEVAPVVGTIARIMQSCSDVSQNVGLVSWPAAGLIPRVTAMTVRIARLGPI